MSPASFSGARPPGASPSGAATSQSISYTKSPRSRRPEGSFRLPCRSIGGAATAQSVSCTKSLCSRRPEGSFCLLYRTIGATGLNSHGAQPRPRGWDCCGAELLARYQRRRQIELLGPHVGLLQLRLAVVLVRWTASPSL
jgi:hypothetical protein